MKDLEKALAECKAELDRINIKYGFIKDIKVNTRSKGHWGWCKKRADGYHIEISERLVKDEVTDWALKQTLIHEILHTIEGGMQHRGEWKAAANKVNKYYNYNIKRATSSEEKGLESTYESNAKYQVKCPKCGETWNYMRMCNTVKYPDRYHCCSCKVDLIRVF